MDAYRGSLPDPAERVATALRRCAEARLRVADAGPAPTAAAAIAPVVRLVHPDPAAAVLHVVVDGHPFPGDSSSPMTALLDVVDVVVGAGPASGVVRANVAIAGRLTCPDVAEQRCLAAAIAEVQPDPSLLAVGTGSTIVTLQVGSVTLVDETGVARIAVDQLMSAGPDPFAEIEGLWLAHLNDARCPVVDRLAERIGRGRFQERPHVVGLDRFGITLGAPGSGGRGTVRLVFPTDCVDVEGLSRQIRLLMGARRSVRPVGRTR